MRIQASATGPEERYRWRGGEMGGGSLPVCGWEGRHGLGLHLLSLRCRGAAGEERQPCSLWERPGLDAWEAWAGTARWSLRNGRALWRGKGRLRIPQEQRVTHKELYHAGRRRRGTRERSGMVGEVGWKAAEWGAQPWVSQEGAAAGRPRTVGNFCLPSCHHVWSKAISTAYQSWEIWVNSNATRKSLGRK